MKGCNSLDPLPTVAIAAHTGDLVQLQCRIAPTMNPNKSFAPLCCQIQTGCIHSSAEGHECLHIQLMQAAEDTCAVSRLDEPIAD